MQGDAVYSESMSVERMQIVALVPSKSLARAM